MNLKQCNITSTWKFKPHMIVPNYTTYAMLLTGFFISFEKLCRVYVETWLVYLA